MQEEKPSMPLKIKIVIMNTPILDYWFKSENRIERPMPKTIRKVPMELKVITECNECWGYVVKDGKPKYYFLYSFFIESPSERSDIPRFNLTIAMNKSIKRHEKKNSHSKYFINS